MTESRDVLEVDVGEWGAVVALRGCDPTEHTAQAVVVVVVDEANQGVSAAARL
jgi:hypothetical protein